MSDKGFGKFGSFEWHSGQIKELASSESVCFYISQLTGVTMMPENTVEQTKEKAIESIRVH